MADHAPLGHFLPYLLGRRLRAVLWSADGGERALALLLLAIGLAYGAGFGVLLNHGASGRLARFLPQLLIGLNATLLGSALLIDFLPALRPVGRPLPEHFPVSARLNVATAFLLDLITLRRVLLLVPLLVAVAVAPAHAAVPGLTLLLVLSTAAFSFNLRLLAALGRWRHPLLALHLGSLALLLWWLSRPGSPHYLAIGLLAAALPWALWAGQLYWLGPYFSVRYLPAKATAEATSRFDQLSPEWKVYVRKAWLPLMMGLVFKVVMVGFGGFMMAKNGEYPKTGFFAVFFIAFLPAIGFTYVNNNLFGFLRSLIANEIQRLGLTPRVLWLYARLVGPVVLADLLLSVVLMVVLFPASRWGLAGLLPLGAVAFLSLGLWGSLYQAKPVVKAIDFANMRNNTSTLMSILTMGVGAALFFMPWWWARGLLAAVVAASAWWPVRQVQRNDGPLRRRLWRGIRT